MFIYQQITKTDKIVGVCGTDRITMVKYSDGEAKRKKVADVLRATEQDIGSGYTFNVSSTVSRITNCFIIRRMELTDFVSRRLFCTSVTTQYWAV